MVTWNYGAIPNAMLYNFVIVICPTTLFKVTYICYVHACVFALKHLKWHVILKYLALLLAISGDNIIYSNLYCMTSRKWYNYCTFSRKCMTCFMLCWPIPQVAALCSLVSRCRRICDSVAVKLGEMPGCWHLRHQIDWPITGR